MKRLFLFLLIAMPMLALAQPAGKHMLLEKITSNGCGGCAYGDWILDSLLADDPALIPVRIHWHDPGHQDSLFSADGDVIWQEYLWASPSIMFDRKKFNDLNYVAFSWLDDWLDHINQRYQDTVLASIGASSTYNSTTRALTVNLFGEFKYNVSGDIRLSCHISEDSVNGVGGGYDQANSFHTSVGHPMEGLGNPITNYMHTDVHRKTLGGPWGQSGIIPASVTGGQQFSHTFNYTLDQAWDDNNIDLTVFVQMYDTDNEKRTVLNAAQLGLNDSVPAILGVKQMEPQLSVKVFPNPANEQFVVRLDGDAGSAELVLTDLSGRIVLKKNNLQRYNTINTSGLASGTYLYSVDSRNGKLVIR